MAKQTNSPAPNKVNMIGEGTVFDGTFQAQSDVRISGRVVGKISVDGKVFVTQEGTVEGELIATNADIGGYIAGQINVSERVILKSTARVDSDIKAERIVMEEGAIFNGQCMMGPTGKVKPNLTGKGASTSKEQIPMQRFSVETQGDLISSES